MPTIKDVAKEAGLAVGTVSRVLNNRGYISDEARRKVDEAMKKLRYHPNENARSLKKQKSNTVGVIVPHIAHPYFSSLVSYIEEEAHAAGFRVILLNSKGLEKNEIRLLDICESNNVAGIILCSGRLSMKDYIRLDLPVVTIERSTEGDCTSIECDNEAGGRIATEHLIERGCRRLLHISGRTEKNMPADLREKGYKEACRDHGLEACIIRTQLHKYKLENAASFMKQVFDDYPETDGIFASNDLLAAGVIQECGRRGISVPGTLKVVGFDGTHFASMLTPVLTTIRQPVTEMARQAVEIIHSCDRRHSAAERIIFPVELALGETT
ncbi:MAG: LacI family DNA-binding transcriptional regulator [Eubacterium sp.]|nr:LacI family DNA-binding transcriptional regulator [Eubacterium sp.]